MPKQSQKAPRFGLNIDSAINPWRDSLQCKSPRIAKKLQTLQRIEQKLLRKLEASSYCATVIDDSILLDEKSSKKHANNQPIRTLLELNTFRPVENNENDTNIDTSTQQTNESTESETCPHTTSEKDLKYEVLYHEDEELGFEINCGNEGVYVSNLNKYAKEKNVSLYSTLLCINSQNVNQFDFDKMKKTLLTLPRPVRITFRKSIISTPYGIGNIINRMTLSNKIQIALEYGTAYINESNIGKFTYNKQWSEFEEDRLFELISKNNNGSHTSRRCKINWDNISDEMHHHRSAKECEKRWELINTLTHLQNEDVLYTKLTLFARKGDYQSVKRIIERCPELLLRPDKNRSTPLFTACWYNKCDIVKLMIRFGAKVNHSNLKGNYPIQMAIENSFCDIVDLLIANDAKVRDEKLNNILNEGKKQIDTKVIRSVHRAQLIVGDKVLYEHNELGTVRAVILEKLNECRPVMFVVKMRINAYHQAIQKQTIPKIIKVSILDERLKPITESVGVPLKELMSKKQKMLERFGKWDMFWTQYQGKSDEKMVESIRKNNTKKCHKIEIKSSHQIDKNNEIKNEIIQTKKAEKNERNKSLVVHENYYLNGLRNVSLEHRCVGLRKLEAKIAQHPDTRDRDFDFEDSDCPSAINKAVDLCYMAKEHAKRFGVVMDMLLTKNSLE